MIHSYLIMLSVSRIETGERFPHGMSLPLHCTLMPWFSANTPEKERKVQQDIKRALKESGMPELVVGSRAQLGPNNDIPCSLIERSSALALFHNRMLYMAWRLGSELKNPEWSGGGYNPHISDRDGIELSTGTRLIPSCVALVRRTSDGTKYVRDIYR